MKESSNYTRLIEMKYVSDHIEEWVNELVAKVQGGGTRTGPAATCPIKRSMTAA